MRDTQKILRHAIFNALTGISVPVYDEKKKVRDNTSLYVLLGTQQEQNDDTMDTFITLSTIDIEVCHKTGSEVSKDKMDDVGNEILERLFPTVQTDGITDPSGVQIQNLRRERTITRTIEITPTESMVRKIITISSQIVQQF